MSVRNLTTVYILLPYTPITNLSAVWDSMK